MANLGSIVAGAASAVSSVTQQTSMTRLGAPEVARSQNQLVGDNADHFKDKFWEYAAVKRDHWNKSYPYRLALYKRHVDGGKTTYRQDGTLAPFTLPIPPEAMTITTPMAVTTAVTLGGIVEEHNGSPLRMISIQGTTGILPLRGNVNSASINLQTSIFAGTLNAANTLVNDAVALGGTIVNKNVVSKDQVDEDGGDLSASTGYYQFKLLERWFEAYMAFKKTSNGRSFVMALEVWKDEAIYLVTPLVFTTRRSAANPLEYMYDMQFKAWKRIRPTSESPDAFSHPPVARDPNKLFKVLNALNGARQVLQDAKNVLKGVRADINNVLFTPIREAVLFCKDAIGVAVTAVDLPANIITDLKEPLLETISLGNTLNAAGGKIKSTPLAIEAAFKSLSIEVSKAEIGGGQINTNQQSLDNASPANKIANNPDDHFSFFENVKPGSLNLRPSTQKKINDEKKRVRRLKREDFEKARDQIQEVLTDFENAVGAGNDTYNRVYSTPTRPSTRVPTESDYDTIYALNATLQEFNRLAASATINQGEISSIDYFAGLASRSGIAFTVPKSKFLVPFPYGHTLEMISSLYLGTADRWHEIAALNGLQAPYVDEVGFSLTLLTNGNGNTVTVSDASKLYVNQQVWISSTTVSRTVRRISKIDKLSDTLVIVTLTGDQDLDQYTVAAGAVLQGFLPNTVNSQMSLYIPSDLEADEDDFRQKSIPGVDYFDPLVRVGGVDLLLTPSGDLVVTPDGDTRLSVGLTNIVQKVRLALDTPRGSLLHHPNYGFPLQPGVSTADLSAKDILSICRDLFKEDPTFSGIESAAILKDGAVVKISLSVGIAGTTKVIPVTVDVRR